MAWREELHSNKAAAASVPLIPIKPQAPGKLPPDSVETVITGRGSTREFSLDSVTFSELSTILESASHKIPADFLVPLGDALTDIYLIGNEVDGLDPVPTRTIETAGPSS